MSAPSWKNSIESLAAWASTLSDTIGLHAHLAALSFAVAGLGAPSWDHAVHSFAPVGAPVRSPTAHLSALATATALA